MKTNEGKTGTTTPGDGTGDARHAGVGTRTRVPVESAEDAVRQAGASRLRMILARMYGRDGMATLDEREIVPHVTSDATVGVVDVMRGAAWDSTTPCTDDILALGTDRRCSREPIDPTGGAREESRESEAPPGWRRIGLHEDRLFEGGRNVPRQVYRPEHWVRPRLKAVGLRTMTGRRGWPVRKLDGGAPVPCRGIPDSHLDWWPFGRPAWVSDRSESPDFTFLLDVLDPGTRRDLAALGGRWIRDAAIAVERCRDEVRGRTCVPDRPGSTSGAVPSVPGLRSSSWMVKGWPRHRDVALLAASLEADGRSGDGADVEMLRRRIEEVVDSITAGTRARVVETLYRISASGFGRHRNDACAGICEATADAVCSGFAPELALREAAIRILTSNGAVLLDILARDEADER